MSISAINCSPLKPQVSFGNAQEVNDATRVLELSKQLEDSFQVAGAEKKNTAQIAVSVLGAGLTMFALGKGAGKGISTIVKGLPETTKTSILNSTKNASIAIKEKVSNLPKTRVSKVLDGTVGKVAKGFKTAITEKIAKEGAEKVFTNATGLAAMATLLPSILTVDGDKNGVADIAQKNISAYSSALQQAEVFSTMLNIVS